MKERPILFSGPMVLAILDGRKTQTRRIIKPQFSVFHGFISAATILTNRIFRRPNQGIKCPYGQPGDRLWVRESGWERPERTPRMIREGADTWDAFYYDADGISEAEAEFYKEQGFARRPSIFMPRWASRITLEILSVRVERLNDISDSDAIREGIPDYPDFTGDSPVHDFSALWESINGPGSWDDNPWVWRIEFRKL